jgi:hypothetical protein
VDVVDRFDPRKQRFSVVLKDLGDLGVADRLPDTNSLNKGVTMTNDQGGPAQGLAELRYTI